MKSLIFKFKLRKSKYIPAIVFLLLYCLAIVSCNHSNKIVSEQLDKAESLMETYPDSALFILESIDTLSIKKASERARRALLLSMALDKNYIDTTDFSILQPALDYYPKHGSPEERVKTRYYEGRIFMNMGEDGLAKKSFLQAEADSINCKDSIALGRLYTVLAIMADRQYKNEDHIKYNIKANKIWQTLGDSIKYLESLLNVLNGANVDSNFQLGSPLVDKCKQGIFKYKGSLINSMPVLLTAYSLFKTKDEFENLMQELKKIKIERDSDKIVIASAYRIFGEYNKAKEYITNDIIVDSLAHYIIKSQILEGVGDYQGAVESYKNYMELEEQRITDKLNNNIFFMEKEYSLEMESMKKLMRRDKIIYVILGGLICVILICITIGLKLRNSQLKRNLAESEKEALNSRVELLQNELSLEKSQLEDLLTENEELFSRTKFLIKERLNMVNGLLAKEISRYDKFAESYDSLVAKIHTDKEAFLNSIKESYSLSHPGFINYLEHHGLTDFEIKYVCLYCLGLRGKDIGIFLEKKSHYNYSLDIRKKLGIDSETSNLGPYVRNLLDTF